MGLRFKSAAAACLDGGKSKLSFQAAFRCDVTNSGHATRDPSGGSLSRVTRLKVKANEMARISSGESLPWFPAWPALWRVALLWWWFGVPAGGAPGPSLRGHLGVHDPSTIIQCKDKYYLFGTGRGISSKVSTDKVFWSAGSRVFANNPNWTTNTVPAFDGNLWAPDIIFANGQYLLYYSVSSWGSQVSAIALATNPTLDPGDPSYAWTDRGIVIQSGNGSPYNTIDPSVTRDADGGLWLCFGSYWNGIYLVQLDPATGLRLAPNSPVHHLASNSSIEASCLYRRGRYYYLFVNWGSCCVGVKSTYHIRVGRSTNITGPYLDRNGVDLRAPGGTLFLEGTGKFTGPGHLGVLEEGGERWFSYHYYDAGDYAPWYDGYGVADFDLRPLEFTADDWPVFTNDWSAVYHFEADARDEHGQFYGLLRGGATIQTDPLRGGVLHLDGTNDYVSLPAGLGFARTFTAVVKWNGGAAWQRIFDFGTDTSSYVMLTPSSGNGRLRLDIRANGTTQILERTAPLPVGVWTHVAVTLDGQRGVLYVNGLPAATNASLSLSPLNVLAQTNHLGRSKFSADPDFNGQVSSFRVYGRALSAAEIATPLPVIAQPVDPTVYWPGTTIEFQGRATDFADVPLAASALTWRVEHLQDGQTNLVLGPLVGVTHGTFSIPTNATRGGSYRILLTARDAANRQRTVSATLLPANPPAPWSSHYTFVSNAIDANGHFHGTLNGGASLANDPERGKVLDLSGSGQFVALPNGAGAFQTFMAWVKWNGGAAWQRIFDFGNGTNRYCVLTPSAANGKLRCAISVNSLAGELILDAPGPLPVGGWTHVAVTLDGRRGVLYTNGVAVATNEFMNLVPADLNSTNNWFGRSNWPDPYFSGRLSAVRLFARALTATEIAAPQAEIVAPSPGNVYRPGDTINFQGTATDFYGTSLHATSFVWSVQWRSNTTVTTVLGPLSGVADGAFTIPATGSRASNGFHRIVLVATDSAARKATNTVDLFPFTVTAGSNWASYYPFTFSGTDASNRYNGTLVGGASIANDPLRGNVLNLGGGGQHMSLPVGASAAQTISGWVKWNGGAAWQRVFDFGTDTAHWFYFTTWDWNGLPHCGITSDSGSFAHYLQATEPFPIGTWTHVAVALDGRQGILYLNGRAIAVNHSVNLLPADLGANRNYFGRSQFPADAYFNGRLDAFKLNSRALSPAELFAPTPRIITPAAGARYTGGEVITFSGLGSDFAEAPLAASKLGWSGEFHHDGIIEPVLGPLNGVTAGDFVIATNGPTSTNAFYRLMLTAADSNGVQTVTTDLRPRIGLLNIATVPEGLQVKLDGQSLVAPASVPAVAGLWRELEAVSPQFLNGSNYSFVLWSDGGAAKHHFSVPATNATFIASFVEPRLEWSRAGANLQLQWPDWAGGLKLYCATNLTPPVAWHAVTNLPLAENGIRTLSLPLQAGERFYRLQP